MAVRIQPAKASWQDRRGVRVSGTSSIRRTIGRPCPPPTDHRNAVSTSRPIAPGLPHHGPTIGIRAASEASAPTRQCRTRHPRCGVPWSSNDHRRSRPMKHGSKADPPRGPDRCGRKGVPADPERTSEKSPPRDVGSRTAKPESPESQLSDSGSGNDSQPSPRAARVNPSRTTRADAEAPSNGKRDRIDIGRFESEGGATPAGPQVPHEEGASVPPDDVSKLSKPACGSGADTLRRDGADGTAGDENTDTARQAHGATGTGRGRRTKKPRDAKRRGGGP